MPAVLPADLLAAAVRREPAAPLLTHYDDVTGGRVELSATTLANWVAKTANLLQDEFDDGGAIVRCCQLCVCAVERALSYQ